MKINIYGIRKLGENKYYYIGRSIDPPEQRVKRHLQDALAGKHRNKRLAEFLIQEKFQVDLMAISKSEQLEYFYIKSYSAAGHPLLNNVYKFEKYNFKEKI